MTTILAVLGTFVVTSAGSVWMARCYLRLGWQLGRDDQALDPGDTTGRLPVGESSGKHALPDIPHVEQTDVMPAVEMPSEVAA